MILGVSQQRYAHFKETAMEAVAGLRPKLKKDGAKRPGRTAAEARAFHVEGREDKKSVRKGTRLLPGKFMAVEQAAATKKGTEAQV